jgi:polar amino acid transport system substrate-binding protein
MGGILPLNFFFYITIFILAIALAPSAQASDSNNLNTNSLVIKAGMFNFPPFYVVNPDQTLSGIILDIMEKTLQHAKIDYSLDIYPAKRLYRNLKSGETGLFLGIKGSPEYEGHVLYSEAEISQIQMRIYAIGNIPLPSRKEDINNHKIITLRGYSYGGLISYFTDPKNNINVTSTSSHRSSFLMLKDRRADYVINYKHPSNAALKNLDIPGLKYSSFYNAKIYFIVSKKLPNAKEILNKLEQAYLELVALGELKYIENND